MHKIRYNLDTEVMRNLSFLIKPVLAIGLFISVYSSVLAQGTPPPPPSGGHGLTGNQPPAGGNAPVDGGVLLLIGLGAAYGARKLKVVKE